MATARRSITIFSAVKFGVLSTQKSEPSLVVQHYDTVQNYAVRTARAEAQPPAAPPHETVLPLWQALWPVTSTESTYSIANDSSMPLRTNTELKATLTRAGVTPQRKR